MSGRVYKFHFFEGLMKMVMCLQEAYGILNDPEKRREFDLGESTPSRGFFEVQRFCLRS